MVDNQVIKQCIIGVGPPYSHLVNKSADQTTTVISPIRETRDEILMNSVFARRIPVVLLNPSIQPPNK